MIFIQKNSMFFFIGLFWDESFIENPDSFINFTLKFQVASGNKTVESWATKRLRVHYYIFSYPSLLKLHGEPSLLRSLDSLLGNEALLQLELKTLSPAFKDVKKKKWFEEVIDNYLKLWESNMWRNIVNYIVK